MTPIFHPVGDKLVEQPRMKEPEYPERLKRVVIIGHHPSLTYYQVKMKEYQSHLSTLRTYAIRPEDWQGITEVREGEFKVEYKQIAEGHSNGVDYHAVDQFAWFAIPKREKDLWEDVAVAFGEYEDAKEAIEYLKRKYTITLNKQ